MINKIQNLHTTIKPYLRLNEKPQQQYHILISIVIVKKS